MEVKKDINLENPQDKMADLMTVSEVDNFVHVVENDLVISTADESHVRETAELWANLATIQQIYAPERYNFAPSGKDWRAFVRSKMEKEHNLLLVAHDKGEVEIKGFLYLQTITIPSTNLVLKGVIEDIYTKPQHRKKNIAASLLKVALLWAEKQKIKQVDLITISKSNDLIQFYLKFIKEYKNDIDLQLVTV